MGEIGGMGVYDPGTRMPLPYLVRPRETRHIARLLRLPEVPPRCGWCWRPVLGPVSHLGGDRSRPQHRRCGRG